MLLVNKPSVSQQYNGLKQVSFGDVMMPLIEMFREAILINGNLNKTIFYGWNSRKSTEHKKKSFLVLLKKWIFRAASANKYIIKTNNRNTRKRCEICSKLTRKTTKFPVGYWANGFIVFCQVFWFQSLTVARKQGTIQTFLKWWFLGKVLSKLDVNRTSIGCR